MRVQFSQQHRCNANHLLLESDQSVLHQLGLDIVLALLSIDEDNCVNIPVCNYNMNAQYLDKGQMVGRLYPGHLLGFHFNPASCDQSSTLVMFSRCSCNVLPTINMSFRYT